MNPSLMKTILALFAVILSVFSALAYWAVPVIGALYLELSKSIGSSLPLITAHYALPMLRTVTEGPAVISFGLNWVSLVWLFLMAAPLLLVLWSLLADSIQSCLTRWTVASMLYALLIMMILATVTGGLLLPYVMFVPSLS